MKNIVFMVEIDKTEGESVSVEEYQDALERKKPYWYSHASWKKWCDKNDAEIFLLTERIYPKDVMNPNWHKLFAFELLDNEGIEYDQILVVDADTIVHPNAPNFFELSDNKFIAVHNEGCYDWLCRSVENYSKHIFDNHQLSPWDYFNSGFMIVNKTHKKLFSDIIKFYLDNSKSLKEFQEKYGCGTDQPIINFFVDMSNVDKKLFPYEFNMQDMPRKEILDNELTFTKLGWVYHFNAIPGGPETTHHWMKKTYEYLKEKY